MTLWWTWLLALLAAIGAYLTKLKIGVSAGAEWLQGRHGWIRIYELTKVTTHYRGNNYWLTMHDRDGRRLELSISLIQENRDVWDLVYNGILHSVIAGGAETNGRLHAIFHVPRPYPPRE
jgi:hypothetical protein